uniref:Tape measure protein n=1 Tax=Mycolicibacterium phage Alyssa1 TaxID=3240801 RepID=A0AB39U232_9CAUD
MNMARKAGMSTGVEVARISVKVGPDTKHFRRELKKDLDRIEESMRAKIDVEPDMKGFRQEVQSKTKGMRTSVKVDADVDRKGFLGRIADSLSQIQPPSFGSGINPTGYAAIAAGIAALTPLIAGTLGAATTALMALPGLVAAVATPIAALTLGIDGLKAAATRLQGPFEDLKATMSSAVESQFGPVFDQLRSLFPVLKGALPSVTAGLADMAKSIADVIASPEGLAKIDTTIRNIGMALTTAAPGVGKFTDGLMGLVQSFTGKPLQGVAEWFSKTGDSFSAWVEKMTRPSWFTGKSPLEVAFGNLGDTLKTIADTLGDVGQKALDFFSDPEKIKSFRDELTLVSDAVKGIATGINGIATAYSSLPLSGEGLKGLMPIQAQLGVKMFDGLKESAAKAFAEVATMAGGFVSNIGSTFMSIGDTLSGIWGGITNAAATAFNSLVSAAQSAVSGVVSAVATIPGQVASALAGLAEAGASAGRNLVQGLVNGISGMIGSAVAKARELASSVASAVTGFLGIHSPSKLFTEIGEYVGQGFDNGLQSQLATLGQTAKAMAETVTEEFNGGLKFGADGFSTDSDNPLMQAGAGLANAPVDFAKATGKQFLSDLGISGNGVLSRALTEGIQYIFQISSVDEALSIKDRETSKNALSIVGR